MNNYKLDKEIEEAIIKANKSNNPDLIAISEEAHEYLHNDFNIKEEE